MGDLGQILQDLAGRVQVIEAGIKSNASIMQALMGRVDQRMGEIQ